MIEAKVSIFGTRLTVCGEPLDTLADTEDAAIGAAVRAILGPDTTWRRRSGPSRSGAVSIIIGTEAIGAIGYAVAYIDERFYRRMNSI